MEHAAFSRFAPPFFLSIALPLVIALAVIRLIVYALRGVFGNAPWMKSSERAIAFTVWVGALLYFTGVLPAVRAELDAITLPLGSPPLSMLEVLQGIAVVVITVAITLWLSGLLERRLVRDEHSDPRAEPARSRRAARDRHPHGPARDRLRPHRAFGVRRRARRRHRTRPQRLAANYIAGFTILLDRSIRMGDMITVSDRSGIVAKVTSRYVVVRGHDGVEAMCNEKPRSC